MSSCEIGPWWFGQVGGGVEQEMAGREAQAAWAVCSDGEEGDAGCVDGADDDLVLDVAAGLAFEFAPHALQMSGSSLLDEERADDVG